MKNRYVKIIPIFISLLTLTFSCLFFTMKKNDFSDLENRYLSQIPTFSFESLKDATYISSLESFTTDHFPFRGLFMNIKTNYEKLLGKTTLNNVIIGSNDYLFLEYNKPKNSEKIVNNLNDFYNTLNYTNMTILLVPTSITINEDKLPNFAIKNSQLEEINYYYQNIKFNSVNVYDILKEKNNEYDMFYHLDHHWTTYGAYYAYQEYIKSNNLNPIDITDFNIEKVSDNFEGTLYSKVIDNYKKDSIYIFNTNNEYKVEYEDRVRNTLYEMSYLDKKDKYALFLDNNHSLITVTNKSLNNNKKILVIKDSYANALVPFLTNHYETTYVIDPRFYREEISKFVKENNILDILILYNINNLDTDQGILTIK